MEQATEGEQYQVFINHRGPDTKKNLASLIYNALAPYGLRVFLDQDELCTGDTVDPAIRRAIKSASVQIAIFSPRYAQSKWCLNELCWMFRSSRESKVIIIPVFYDVDPADLRYIDGGPYAEAFNKHRQRVSTEVVNEWREALKAAASISGLTFKTNESDYGKFVREIENIVIKRVEWDPLEVASHPVGLDEAMKDLDDHIQKRSYTKVVGIAGVGGMGKSTLAKHFFNSKRCVYSRACYLFNVREKVDLTCLQRQLLRDLLGKEKDIANPLIGKNILRNSLKGLKILIVFDDVDDSEKIEMVLDMHAVEPGSLIFITSRDKVILRFSSANIFWYDVKPLKRNHARELFCRHCFLQSNPFEGYEDLVEGFLDICEGLPLCLKVWGEQLAGNLDRTYWKRQLENFSQGLPLTEEDNVINTLKWSYKALEMEQKEMLLDVGCFFVGEDLELAVRVLEGLVYFSGVRNCLESLRQKCLVDFNNDMESDDEIGNQSQDIALSQGKHLILPGVLPQRTSKIIMQNPVKELARRIVREDLLHTMDKPLRLSCSVDIEKMLELQSGPVKIRGICIRKDRSPPQLPNNINITGVRLLVVEHPINDSMFLGSISGNLVWLRWRVSPFISLPRTISLAGLRVLELQIPQGDLERLFSSLDFPNKIPFELRVVNIDAMEKGTSSSISSSPQPVDPQHYTKSSDGNISTTGQRVVPSFFLFLQSIGSFIKNLTEIVLKNFRVPQSLPFDCSGLKNLRHLDLSGCTNLTRLPNSFSQLLQLQYLSLQDCTNLYIPMDMLGEISTLEHIDFKGCAKLVHLPQGIAFQRRLRYLNLLHTSLLELPLNLEPQYGLEQLRIGSASLTELPYSVAYYVHLKELILVECFTLRHINTPIEQLTCLERLEIYGSNVPILPAGIALLKHLKVLTIYNCPIQNFALDNHVMEALRDFTLSDTSITDINVPAGACPKLEIVDLSCNFHLQKVEVSQSTLVKLNLNCCSSLKYLKFPEVVNLKFLNINGCGYVEIQNVAKCRSLEEIRAERCLFVIEEAWSWLERLNFFSFSQDFDFFSRKRKNILFAAEEERRRWPTPYYEEIYKKAQMTSGVTNEKKLVEMAVKEFEKLMNSFPDVTVLEVPDTATPTSPMLVKNVDSHKAILMCFLTVDMGPPWIECDNFNIRFEACNSVSHCEVFKTGRGDGGGGLWVHMYMWTHDSQLFKNQNHLYKNVSIYKEGKFDVECGERGWILGFSSENNVLNVCNQIMNPSQTASQLMQ